MNEKYAVLKKKYDKQSALLKEMEAISRNQLEQLQLSADAHERENKMALEQISLRHIKEIDELH